MDKEWNDFYNSVISNGNDGIVEKTRKIQEDYLQNLTLDNGYVKNIRLIDKTNIHNNHLQVINQYEECDGKHSARYDVTILVNGLPLVHIELKSVAIQFVKRLIKSTAISVIVFGLVADCISMFRYL